MIRYIDRACRTIAFVTESGAVLLADELHIATQGGAISFKEDTLPGWDVSLENYRATGLADLSLPERGSLKREELRARCVCALVGYSARRYRETCDAKHRTPNRAAVVLAARVGERAAPAQRGEHRIVEGPGKLEIFRADGRVADHRLSPC